MREDFLKSFFENLTIHFKANFVVLPLVSRGSPIKGGGDRYETECSDRFSKLGHFSYSYWLHKLRRGKVPTDNSWLSTQKGLR